MTLPAGNARDGLGSTHGARVIDSTPPATTTSASPVSMAREAIIVASRLEPQSRFTVVAGTLTGSPASSTAIRPTLRLSSPAPLALPHTTSSIRRGRGRAPGRAPRQGDRGQVVGADLGQRAAEPAERRAGGGIQIGVGHASGPPGRGLRGSSLADASGMIRPCPRNRRSDQAGVPRAPTYAGCPRSRSATSRSSTRSSTRRWSRRSASRSTASRSCCRWPAPATATTCSSHGSTGSRLMRALAAGARVCVERHPPRRARLRPVGLRVEHALSQRHGPRRRHRGARRPSGSPPSRC